jgi:phosphomannomutase/phosphoglucomutase
MQNIPAEIFRAYDIRGIVGESLTEEIVFYIGKAIGSEAKSQNQRSIIIARDGRLSGPTLSEALRKGILDTGCDVIDIGSVPTPLLYFATNILSTQSGVMLTGSHNPSNYNGLKVVINGKTLSEEKIQQLYQRIINHNLESGQGKYSEQDISEKYISRILEDVNLSKSLKIIIDAGNGIAGKIAPTLFKRLGCEVIELFCEVDGNFPNHHPDPTIPENLKDIIEAVRVHKADVGLAFDGDGDRLGVVTNLGEIIWPDRQLMLYAEDVLSRNKSAKIIYDVKCTQHLSKIIKEAGGVPLMWKTGHSLIKNKMREENSPLSGEMSGHIFFKDRWYGFDDGLYTGVRLLEILSKQDKSISEIFQSLPNSINTPELKLAVNNDQRSKLIEGLKISPAFQDANLITIDGVRIEFEKSWGLMRGSNTTPHLILRFEAEDENHLKEIQDKFRKELLKLDSSLELPF